MVDRIEIAFADLPDWVRKIVQTELGNKRPHAYVHYSDSFKFHAPWHECCNRHYWARDPHNGTVKHLGTARGNTGYLSSRDEQIMFKGGTVNLQPGQALVIVETYPPSVHLYMHPADSSLSLSAETPALDEFDAAILDALISLTSAGRKDTWERYRVPIADVNAAYRRLQALGLAKINRAGAVQATLTGRQTRDRINGERADTYFYRQWAERK